MKSFFKLSILSLMIIGIITGCGQAPTVQSIDNSNYFSKAQAKSSVAKAIKRGASSKGWRTKTVKNGLIEANILVRGKYFVAVDIPYTSKGYKVEYKSSRNLKYDSATKTIHGSYNKWTKLLSDKINYELENIGMQSAAGVVTTMAVAAPLASAKKPTKNYTKGYKLNLNGKTIYVKPEIVYTSNSRVSDAIKQECTIPQALSENILKKSIAMSVNMESKKDIKANEIELKIEIIDAVSSGNAAIGHSKFMVIHGSLVKGDTKYASFKAARHSGGGFFGAYRSSCSVLAKITKALGQDTAGWLMNPVDGAKLGDVQLIR
jgi:hypothetical protein